MPLALQGGSPDTTSYLILGLIVVTVLVIALVASMVVRYRNLRHDVELLEQLEEDEKRNNG